MANIRPKDLPAVTTTVVGDKVLIDGASARSITVENLFTGRVLGTANEITATGGVGTITMSLPAAMTLTGKTMTGGTFANPAISGATITTSTFNGNTWTAGTGILTLGAGKTLTASNTLTFTGTDGSTAAFGAGGTVAYVANKLSAFAATTSLELKGVISDETGSGSLVFATSPTLVTPALGAATATTINGATVSPGHYSGEPSSGSAAAGEIGEFTSNVTAIGSPVSLTNNTPVNVNSGISLAAGDWDVWACVGYVTSAATVQGIRASISQTTGTEDATTGNFFAMSFPGTDIGGTHSPEFFVTRRRVSSSGATNAFLVARAAFSAGTVSVFGGIYARRAR